MARSLERTKRWMTLKQRGLLKRSRLQLTHGNGFKPPLPSKSVTTARTRLCSGCGRKTPLEQTQRLHQQTQNSVGSLCGRGGRRLMIGVRREPRSMTSVTVSYNSTRTTIQPKCWTWTKP
eukprot:PhF_6_TR43161/c0_g1_i1/m.66099